jgi:hypothetical protein
MQLEHPALGRKPDAIDAPDWVQIRTDYELGAISVREIARRHGVSDTAIHKRARAESWKGLHQPQTTGANYDAPPLQTGDVIGAVEIAVKKYCGPGPIDDGFDWDTDDSVAIRRKWPLAVYANRYGRIVLRQEDTEEGDQFIYVDPSDVALLVRKLQELGNGEA